MSKKKHKPAQLPQGPYKKYINDMQLTLKAIDYPFRMADMPDYKKRQLFEDRLHIHNPVAGNDAISKKELKLITEKEQHYYRHGLNDFQDFKLSGYQMYLMYSFLSMNTREYKRLIADPFDPKLKAIEEMEFKAFDSFRTHFLINYFKIFTQLSNPDTKHFSGEVDTSSMYDKNNPRFEIDVKLYGFPARSCILAVHGVKRPAFRMAKPLGSENHIEWLVVNRSVLGDAYKGNKEELEVYIQSHALRRLRERLDVLEKEAINYVLWENTMREFNFIHYQNHLLLPLKVSDIKVGYLVAQIVDDKLLFSTFLFITHSSTPQGDKLKKITGLSKQEIAYWKIDRLSTLLKVNEERYPELIDLFDKAEIGNLKKLRDKELDVDSLQDANLDSLISYMNKSKL
jgi:hypothetical protein